MLLHNVDDFNESIKFRLTLDMLIKNFLDFVGLLCVEVISFCIFQPYIDIQPTKKVTSEIEMFYSY